MGNLEDMHKTMHMDVNNSMANEHQRHDQLISGQRRQERVFASIRVTVT